MLQYYKLALVRAGQDTALFKREFRLALKNLQDPKDQLELKNWFRETVKRINGLRDTEFQ